MGLQIEVKGKAAMEKLATFSYGTQDFAAPLPPYVYMK